MIFVGLNMRPKSTIFLKSVLFLLAVSVSGGLIMFPRVLLGSNLDSVHIYTSPLIIYIYLASIPFFIALVQAYQLLRFIEKNYVFSQISVEKLRNIKYCASLITALLAGAIFYLQSANLEKYNTNLSIVGVIAMFTSIVIATAAGVFESLLQSALQIKSENDLTV